MTCARTRRGRCRLENRHRATGSRPGGKHLKRHMPLSTGAARISISAPGHGPRYGGCARGLSGFSCSGSRIRTWIGCPTCSPWRTPSAWPSRSSLDARARDRPGGGPHPGLAGAGAAPPPWTQRPPGRPGRARHLTVRHERIILPERSFPLRPPRYPHTAARSKTTSSRSTWRRRRTAASACR